MCQNWIFTFGDRVSAWFGLSCLKTTARCRDEKENGFALVHTEDYEILLNTLVIVTQCN